MEMKGQATIASVMMQSDTLFLSYSIGKLKKCPICLSKNEFIAIEDVIGFDNIPDLMLQYRCSRYLCPLHMFKRKIYIGSRGVQICSNPHLLK